MTKEEAAEVILGGDPFETCTTCKGDGFTYAGTPTSCTKCLPEADTKIARSGKVLRPEYAEAYAVVGMTPPNAKWSPPDYSDL